MVLMVSLSWSLRTTMLLLAIHSQKQQEWLFSSVTVMSQLGECRLKSPTKMVGL